MAVPPTPGEVLATELFAELGAIRTKRMFGGAGVYADELFFALVVGDDLYIKADDDTEAAFRSAGSAQFTWESAKGPMAMRYWRLPDPALDDPDEALRWGRLGVEAAVRAKAGAGRKTSAKRTPKLLIDGPWDDAPEGA